ncbi:MAG: hypothetical protein AABX23_01975 [Nanoarchaeota archaeon]
MKNLLVLAFFISLIVLVMTLFIYFYYITPISEFSFQTTAFVTQDVAGFDVNSTALTFGSIVLGGSSTRSILVNNSYPFSVRVEPKFDGSIKKIITYEPLIVEPYHTSKFYFTVSANSLELLGNYTGDVNIKLMRLT